MALIFYDIEAFFIVNAFSDKAITREIFEDVGQVGLVIF